MPNVDISARADDTRRTITDSTETLGAAAAELGHEAVKIGRDAAKLSREAIRRSMLWAATGGEALRKASTEAATTIDDLRSYQIVRRRRGPDWRPGIALIAGAGAGLAAMYLLDPEQGRRRRIQLMDQVSKYARISGEWLDATARDLRNRSAGLAIEARKSVEQMRSQPRDYENVMAAPDVAEQLARTDWPEPEPATAEPEPATADPYRG